MKLIDCIKGIPNPMSMLSLIKESVEYSDPHKLPEEAPEVEYGIDFRPYDRLAMPRYRNAYIYVWAQYKGFPNMGRWNVPELCKQVEPGQEDAVLAQTKEEVAKLPKDPEWRQERWIDARNEKIEHYDGMANGGADYWYRSGRYSGD